MPRDYYELLQLRPEATAAEIQKAYRSLAMRFHPDRNSSLEAASTMALINEAYSVLGEPARRMRYDRERLKETGIAQPILRAAHETLLKKGWLVAHNDGSTLILEQGKRAVRVSFVETLDSDRLRRLSRQFAGFSVVLTVSMESPLNLSFHAAVIDLMSSRHHGAAFPDEVYRGLFSAFL